MLQLIQPLRVRVHDQHDLPVGGILRLIEQAASPLELPEVLEGLCSEVSTILSAPVVSIYVRESAPSGDVLVMRANVGLPRGAVDHVRLAIGEGITGFAAECLRPVSADVGPDHDRYKPVPGIGEESFPCYLAVPLVQGGQALGVMVLQRPAHDPFDETEVLLGTALGAPFAHALDLSRSGRSGGQAGMSRDVALSAESVVEGKAIGSARPLPTVEGLLGGSGEGGAEVAKAFGIVCQELAKGARKAMGSLSPSAVMALGALVPLLSDQRLREHVVRACAQLGPAKGLDEVARAYARTPYRVAGDHEARSWLAERAQDVEDLCLLVAARVAGVPLCRGGDALWVHGRLGGIVALGAASRRVSAVVVDSSVDRDGLPAGILREADIPVVAGVGALSDWARAGDKLLVDGHRGVVRVNPAPQRVAKLRLSKKG